MKMLVRITLTESYIVETDLTVAQLRDDENNNGLIARDLAREIGAYDIQRSKLTISKYDN